MRKSNFLFLVLFFACLSALPAQDFIGIDRDLDRLEALIIDSLKDTEKREKLLEDLEANLNKSGDLIGSYENIIQEREKSLEDLREQLNGMSETYRKQSVLSAKYERSSKFWRTCTIVAVPIAAVLGAWAGVSLTRR